MIDGKPLTGAAKAGLNFVGDKQRAIGLRPVGQTLEEARGRDDEATFTLNGLDEYGGQVVHAHQ